MRSGSESEDRENKRNEDEYNTVLKKECFAYGVLNFSSKLLSQLTQYSLIFFYTDVFKLPPATLIVFFLAAKVFDIAGVQLVAYFIDSGEQKQGKYKHHVILSIIPMALATCALFFTPDLPVKGKIIYAYITYFIWNIIKAYQALSIQSLLTIISGRTQDRISANSARMVGSVAATLIVSSFFLSLTKTLGKGNDALGFFLAAILLSAFVLPINFVSIFNIKERSCTKNTKKKSVRIVFQSVFLDKNLILILLVGLIFTMANVLKSQIAPYYFKYIIEQPELVGAFFMVGTLSSLLMQVVLNKFSSYFKIETLMMTGFLFSIIGFVIILLSGKFIFGIWAGNIVLGLASAVPSNLIYILLCKHIDQANARYGVSLDSWLFSVYSGFGKIGTGLSESLCSYILFLTNYSAEGPVTKEALGGIYGLFLFGSIFLIALSFILIAIYKKTAGKSNTAVPA